MEQNYERFGCCAFWSQCTNGKNCRYAETAPNKMKACGMYISQELEAPVLTESVISTSPQEQVVPVPAIEPTQSQELVQLSLF